MNRTRFLVAALGVVILMQLFPARAAVIEMLAIMGAALYSLSWAVHRYVAHRRKEGIRAARQAADEAEYRQYRRDLDDIRMRHDPSRDWSEPTALTPEYENELAALHERYQAMLTRKFGPR